MIIAEFTNQNEISITDALYQYDYGRELQIKGLSLPQSVEIHFSFTETIGESTTVLGTTTDDITSVIIPNEFLQKETTEDYIIYVYIYVADENKGQTIKEIKLYVKARTKPAELEDLDDEQTRLLEQLISAINSKADNITYSNSILKLLAGQTELARVTISGGGGGGADAREIELRNNGEYIQWRYVGDSSWINLVALEDLKGEQGKQGSNGFSPTVSITPVSGGARIEITDIDGVHVATILDGTDGTDGTDGFSPIVEVTPTSTGHTVSITDKDGTKTFNVLNGTNGQDGQNGQDLVHQGETVTSSGAVTKELSPNVFCLISDTTTGISDLTLTLANGNYYDEYMCAFTTSSSGCNLSLPNTVSYLGSAPTLEPNTYYELSIVNNKAVIG